MIGAQTVKRGLSVVEGLAALAILAILVLLTLPLLARLEASQRDAKCVSNLRQIGLGVLAYAHDKDGRLPGPLYTGQYPYWNSTTQMSWYLADYLKLDKSMAKLNWEDVFTCPAYEKAVQVGSAPVFTVNIEVLMKDWDRPRQPFGYPNSKKSEVFQTQKDYQPLRLVELADIVDASGHSARSTTWAMMDADQQDERFLEIEAGYRRDMVDKMVHGGHRNVLFFDFHVGRLRPTSSSLNP